ncbi:GntR family transcriptional regulator [Martelella alba]|uniref:GntR family transcriptional regulator n=1 Tax=Martelella alba TaxID=2590451 RepID=A0A506UJ46_9HYPH|nr:GntR family transcriptional regulator [Martelella alba]TPW33354.1 GntR family transcriptional regulator [Martelella alba]
MKHDSTMDEGLRLSIDSSQEDRAHAIRDALRDAIVDRRLAPGTRLPEAEVGTLFNVSRTVARYALQMLAFEGLVQSERNKGAIVSNPSPEEARQVFAARRLIEPGIVATAIERIGPAEIERFRQQLAEEDHHKARRGGEAKRSEIKASGDFHLLLAEFAGNAVLEKFMSELVARSSLVIALYGRSGVSSCGHSEHEEILAAIEAGDPESASATMLRHIDLMEGDLDLRPRDGLTLRDALQV